MSGGKKSMGRERNKRVYAAQFGRTAENKKRNAARYGAEPAGVRHPKAGKKKPG